MMKSRCSDGGEEMPWRSVQATHGVRGTCSEAYRCLPGKAARFPHHAHAEYQLYLNHDLPYRYEYRGERFIVPPNVLCVFHTGEAHGGEDVGDRKTPSQFRLLYIDPDSIREIASEDRETDDLPSFDSPLADDPRLAALFVDVHQALLADGTAARLQIDTALMHLMQGLSGNAASLEQRNTRRSQRLKAVRHAQAYLHENCTQNVTLAELVAECHLSGRYLHHAFCDHFGLPPHAYLLNVRIGQAKAMLLQGMPLPQVAHEAGFADQSHFTRCFRRLVGVTPRHYLCGTSAKNKL